MYPPFVIAVLISSHEWRKLTPISFQNIQAASAADGSIVQFMMTAILPETSSILWMAVQLGNACGNKLWNDGHMYVGIEFDSFDIALCPFLQGSMMAYSLFTTKSLCIARRTGDVKSRKEPTRTGRTLGLTFSIMKRSRCSDVVLLGAGQSGWEQARTPS
jgi:hypothetical protein